MTQDHANYHLDDLLARNTRCPFPFKSVRQTEMEDQLNKALGGKSALDFVSVTCSESTLNTPGQEGVQARHGLGTPVLFEPAQQ